MIPYSWLEQARLLHRLEEPEGDEELERALERLRKNFYELWKVLAEYREDPERVEEWQRGKKPDPYWRKRVFFEEALKVLDTALYG